VAEKAAAPATAGTARAASGTGISSLGIMVGLLLAAQGHRRRHEDDAGARGRQGSLMRHILAAGPIAGLAGRVVDQVTFAPQVVDDPGILADLWAASTGPFAASAVE